MLACLRSAAVATILVVLVAVGVTAFVASRRTTGEFQRYVGHGSSPADRSAASPTSWRSTYSVNQSWDGIQPEIEQLGQISGQRVVVADADGKVVADSERKLIGRAVGMPTGRRAGSARSSRSDAEHRWARSMSTR